MDTWSITNVIKSGDVKYYVNDVVLCFRRKTNGYPKRIDNGEYVVTKVQNDFLYVAKSPLNINITTMIVKVHKNFMIHKI